MLLKLYIYGYLNRVQSSRRLEREAQRNVELMWLTERLSPDHKTISDFRKDNSKALRAVCREFVVLCRRLNLFAQALVVIDGSKFKAVNNRDRNFTRAKMKRRLRRSRRVWIVISSSWSVPIVRSPRTLKTKQYTCKTRSPYSRRRCSA